MTDIARAQVVWSGAQGLPGISTFYAESSDGLISALGDWVNEIVDFLPQGISLTVPGSGDVFNDATGALVGAWNYAAGAHTVTGTVNSVYAAGVGACMNWVTDGIVSGRRVRGRTFIAPIAAAFLGADGTLDNTARASIEVSCLALVANVGVGDPLGLSIWHRPVNGAGGVAHQIVNGGVPDRVSALRSRRY